MTDARFLPHLTETLAAIEAEGLMKRERALTGAQGAHVRVAGREMLNLCANNYLGLAADPRLVAAAKSAMDSHGFGLASVRFICGTQDLHRALETRLAAYLGTEDALLFAACFDANGGLFEPLFTEEDAIVSDSLNHASIIDGIRLSKARRFRYRTGDMEDPDHPGPRRPRRRRALRGHRHRRRLLDGRLLRRPRRHPPHRRRARLPRDGRRLPRHRLRRPAGAAARRPAPGCASTS